MGKPRRRKIRQRRIMPEDKITNLKIDQATMAEQINNLDDRTCRIEEKLDKYIAKDEEWKDNLDRKYASKEVELIVYAGVGIGIAFLLNNILGLL